MEKSQKRAYELLSKISLTRGYWRTTKELSLFRVLLNKGLVKTINAIKPEDYKCNGHCFYVLTRLGISLIEQQKQLEVC